MTRCIRLARKDFEDCLSERDSDSCAFVSFCFVLQGSGATGDCCSKCWRELQKKEGSDSAAALPEKKDVAVAPPAAYEPMMELDGASPEPMDVEPDAQKPAADEKKASAPGPTPKKKKKKTNYKNLMAGMMQSSPDRDVEMEKQNLRKVTGGGAFSKIDKI